MFKNIIFDLDGTLIDSAHVIIKCLSNSLNYHDITPFFPINESMIGPPLEELLSKILKFSDFHKIELIIDTFIKEYDSNVCADTQYYLGVPELLKNLKNQNYKLFVATNKRKSPTNKIIDNLELRKYLNHVICIDSFEFNFKNKSLMLVELIDRFKLNKEETIYIGDMQSDYDAAFKNDLKFIFADWGYGKYFEEYENRSKSIDELYGMIVSFEQ